jgi:hypothetical protein
VLLIQHCKIDGGDGIVAAGRLRGFDNRHPDVLKSARARPAAAETAEALRPAA